MLQAFEQTGRFWRGNIHGHSTNSDGRLEPEEVCRRYRDQGYDFIALTDHFRPNFNYPISDTRPYRGNGFTTILGAEVHAPETSGGTEWHILAVGLPADFPATTADETGPTLARRCAEAGAFVAIAHPHWYQLTLEDALSIESAHAVEVYNHTCAVNADRADGLVMLDSLLTAGRRLNAIAVDDSHWKAPDAFGGWVMVKAAENDPDALLDALKSGEFYASQGPGIPRHPDRRRRPRDPKLHRRLDHVARPGPRQRSRPWRSAHRCSPAAQEIPRCLVPCRHRRRLRPPRLVQSALAGWQLTS